MDFGLSTEQKRTILLSSKTSILNDLYVTLIRIGVDPDTFDGSLDIPENDISMYGETARVAKMVEGLALIEAKLQALEV
jgi:hypothetical protein